MQKVILLIGGTGFIGSEILKQLEGNPLLLRKQKQIIVLTNQSKNLSREKAGKIRFIRANLLDFNQTREVFAGLKKENILIETIIQSCQFPNHPVERPWLSENFSYLGFEPVLTSNVINVLKLLNLINNLDQYIYLSGVGLEEPLNQKYSWIQAKLFCESLVKQLSQEFSNFKYTILRPSWVYGQKDRSMNKFIFLIKSLGIFPMIGSGREKVNPVWVEDLAKITVNSIERKEALNQTFEIGSYQITMNELVQSIFNILEKEPKMIPQPKILLKLAASLGQFLPFSPVSPGLIDFVTMESNLKSPEQEVLGVRINSLRAGLLKSRVVL